MAVSPNNSSTQIDESATVLRAAFAQSVGSDPSAVSKVVTLGGATIQFGEISAVVAQNTLAKSSS